MDASGACARRPPAGHAHASVQKCAPGSALSLLERLIARILRRPTADGWLALDGDGPAVRATLSLSRDHRA
jgi:hypothetical protein